MTCKKEGPDQGRSWAIAFAAFMIYALLSGITRTMGLFYVALIQTYGVTRLQANLPFSIRNVMRNLAGPLVGVLGQRYGPRGVTIVGGVLASLGIILCTFAPNVLWITILWGGMHGLGVALSSTLSQVIVPQYFLKYRSTASGFALSGPCLGSFVLPVLLEYMLAHLGLAGTFLVTGGIIMNVLPVSIMMVEPSWIRKKAIHGQSNLKTIERKEKFTADVEDLKSAAGLNLDLVLSPENLKKDTDVFLGVEDITKGIDNPIFCTSQMNLKEMKLEQEVSTEGPTTQNQFRTVPLEESNVTKQVFNKDDETSISGGMVQVLRSPMFHLISLSYASFAMVVDPALTIIVDYLMDKGHPEDVAKYFIFMMSISDLVGRMGFGWVTDNNYLSMPKFMTILHVGLGVCFLLMPLFNNFDSLMAVVVIYGLFSGAILVMFPILVGKYLQSVQSLAIGFSAFFSGLLNFAVPPLIGYFRDKVGSYDGMFCLTGSLSIVMGISWLFEPVLVNLGAKLNNEQSISSIVKTP